ncbi:hypothetical protein LHP98_01380 [Rhodobacter sp. Har01]|uniref:hypothetical protein n=1 Tax=Rhodobacter sp. Har01 TaxID=2883999 RepID=UPI001D08ADC7|nr:hypothetical protein [Rhodobacter sp. Har01]MCB6176778.1 hypothetical protein [Rhodobacter sp. Har01]
MILDTETGLSPLLSRTAQELRRCRDIVLRIEVAVHGLVDDGAIRDTRLGADLQAIDLLDQRLADLSDWVAALARSAEALYLPAAALPRLDDLRLADLRHALAGRDGAGAADPRTELF